MAILFWICLAGIAYTYLLYPISIILVSRLFPEKQLGEAGELPAVTMVVSAYNEDKVLEEKISNCLALEYPSDKITFLFGSDGSQDLTNQILQGLHQHQFQVRIFPSREGKSAVLNKLLEEISGGIVLFSDANSIYRKDALLKLVHHFSDPCVGGVCGRLQLVNPSGEPGGEGEGLYWRFENSIKEAEGRIKTVISANGAIFAIRRELFRPFPGDRPINDDLALTLTVLQHGSCIRYETEAVALEVTSPSMGGEFARKVRISSLNFNSLPELVNLLHPRYGFTALAILSHKLVRWMVPGLGFGLLLSNIALGDQERLYLFTLIGQCFVYLGALLGWLGDRLFKNSGPFIPFYYLAMINLALVLGLWRSLTRTQDTTWERVPHD